MAPPKMVYAMLLAGCAIGCSVVDVELTPLSPAGAPVIADQNPVYVPLGKEQYGKVYENVLQTLHDFGFTVAETNRYDGRIEVVPRVAPGVGFLLKPGSPDIYERWLATAQTYRHRITIVIHPAEQGGYFIEVTARKELEDLPRPVRSAIGGAIFRLNNNIDRDTEVIDPNVYEANWIYKGRDPALEQEIIRRLKKLM